MASWPATLPPLPQVPARFALPTGIIRTQNDVGPAQVRRVTTANVEPWAFPYVLHDDTQLATFRTFVETTLAGGSLAFQVSYFGATRDVRFVSLPEIEDLGADRYRAFMDLEVLPDAA